MNYKDTLLLPNTSFAMRGNLPNNEPIKYSKWNDEKIYEKMQKNRENSTDTFTLHDGPPYANGDIHIGHALNKILKDIIVKYHYFQGKKVKFTPGWDCHGLPIEQQIEKKIGTQKKEQMPPHQFRQMCREHAEKFHNIQSDEFKALGIHANWDVPYLTMENHFEANIYRELCEVIKQGLLVEKSKPINWSWAARTALAEAEIEYEDKESDSIYVAFPLSDEANKSINTQNAKVIIWTTTPWTIPANQGVCVNKEEQYIITQDGFIVAKQLHNKLKEKEIIKGDIKENIDISKLEKQYVINPLNDRKSLIMFGEHVSIEDGTGVVHTAPGHGEDDYRVSLKYGLEVIMPVDERGCFDELVVTKKLFKNPADFVGMHIFKSHEKIFELLGENLLLHTKITHSYPHCWRTHKPTIFRATKQWFIALDKPYFENKTLREVALEEIETINFHPISGKNRLKTMIENRPDWCISRQRSWGVPIALFRNKKTKEVIFDEQILNYIAMIFDVKGADAWYDLEIKELLYPGAGINPDDLEKIDDILDVWFDSGSTQFAVLRSRLYDAGNYPADVYLEGSDQHRGWFQSSLLISCATQKQAPYKSVITHGFSMDKNGEKMSKSKGNVVDPSKISKDMGSEIIRLWVASSDYQNDQKISDNILKQVSEQYRKTRNTIRFLLANIDDIDEIMDISQLNLIDIWILEKAKKVFDDIEDNFAKYDFVNGLNTLNNFLVVELSGIYLDLCKDKLYCNAKDDIKRKSAQSTMAMITKAIYSTLAPILTYTIDEAISHSPDIIKQGCDDIFDWQYYKIPTIEKIDFDEKHIFSIKDKFFEQVDKLKKDKIVKSTLELVMYTKCEKINSLEKDVIEDIFMISRHLSHREENPIISFETDNGDIVEFYQGNKHKCPRCWKLRSESEDILCKRCEDVVN
jgi:isoleucyl-tRNA synthetase